MFDRLTIGECHLFPRPSRVDWALVPSIVWRVRQSDLTYLDSRSGFQGEKINHDSTSLHTHTHPLKFPFDFIMIFLKNMK